MSWWTSMALLIILMILTSLGIPWYSTIPHDLHLLPWILWASAKLACLQSRHQRAVRNIQPIVSLLSWSCTAHFLADRYKWSRRQTPWPEWCDRSPWHARTKWSARCHCRDGAICLSCSDHSAGSSGWTRGTGPHRLSLHSMVPSSADSCAAGRPWSLRESLGPRSRRACSGSTRSLASRPR